MKVALLGFGTVGVGVYEMISSIPEIEVKYVLVRAGKEDQPYKVSDIKTITDDDSIKCVIEVIGGIDPAYEYAKCSLMSGKSFITSNKALVAKKGIELSKLAFDNKVSFLFSAACGGGVPFLHNLYAACESDTVVSIGGILNGTTNYILDAMQRKNLQFPEALKNAQALGYAEANPTDDISGLDSLRKIILASAVAYKKLPVSGLDYEGIQSFTSEDAAYFKSCGLTCRLSAKSLIVDDEVCIYVEPALFPASSPECSVTENYNMAKYCGRNCGDIILIGQGAGRYPTASAVVRDLTEIFSGNKQMMSCYTKEVKADNSMSTHDYILRTDITAQIPFNVYKKDVVDKNAYYYIKEISVSRMHESVKKMRSIGNNVFFASLN